MSTVRSGMQVTLRIRHCVCCGYAGAEMQGDPAALNYECPACSADLYARPPRSYFEMEGITEPSPPVGAALPVPDHHAADPGRFMSIAETCVLASITLVVVTFMAARLVGLV